jgi:RND family efflux transporter MFP subunit
MKSNDDSRRQSAALHDDTAPPRFAKTMGVVRWAIFGAMTVFAIVMVLSHFGATPRASDGDDTTQFHCPMHPTYVVDQKGDCPICGMSLVPVKSGSADDASHTAGRAVGPSAVPGLVPVTLEPRRVQMIGVRTGRVERRAMDTDMRLAGYVTVDETRTATVNARTSGWVEALHVDQTGEAVSRGVPLLALYSQDIYAAGQDLLNALASFNRATVDSALSLSRRRVLDAARDRLRLLGMSADDVARLEETGDVNTLFTLRSPFSGVVLEKNVVDGQFVTPDQALFRIADLGTVWVVADVYERDIASVRAGAPAQLSVAAFPGETFDGKIAFVYPTVSEATRTLKVRIEFSNPSLRLRPGMYAEVAIAAGGPEEIAVPAEAVMDGGKTQYTFVVRDRTTFEPRLVTTGRRFDGWVEILSGLEVGEQVVTSANFLIDSESRLQAAVAGYHDQSNH